MRLSPSLCLLRIFLTVDRSGQRFHNHGRLYSIRCWPSTMGNEAAVDANSPKRRGTDAMDDNKSKALAAALSQIEKQFGKGSIMKMDDAAIKDIEVVSTGSLGLDVALGVGGLPRGRVVEIYGPEASGKTTLTLQVIAGIEKVGGPAAFI